MVQRVGDGHDRALVEEGEAAAEEGELHDEAREHEEEQAGALARLRSHDAR